MSVDHFLLTRFHVRINTSAALPSDDWIRERQSGFEQICLPSVLAQSSKAFRWLVLIDEESPAWVSEYLDRVLPSNAEQVRVAGICEREVVSQVVSDRTRGARVITSRLDSDDAISPRYIGEVGSALSEAGLGFLNFTDGFQLSNGRLLHYRHPSNAFISAVAPRGPSPLTVFADWHDRLGRFGPIRQVPRLPLWVQHCHGDNVANRERGIRANHARYAAGFPSLPLIAQGHGEYLADLALTAARAAALVVADPRRVGRLTGRGAAGTAKGGE